MMQYLADLEERLKDSITEEIQGMKEEIRRVKEEDDQNHTLPRNHDDITL